MTDVSWGLMKACWLTMNVPWMIKACNCHTRGLDTHLCVFAKLKTMKPLSFPLFLFFFFFFIWLRHILRCPQIHVDKLLTHGSFYSFCPAPCPEHSSHWLPAVMVSGATVGSKTGGIKRRPFWGGQLDQVVAPCPALSHSVWWGGGEAEGVALCRD